MGVTLKTFLISIFLCFLSEFLETICLSSHSPSLSSILPCSHSSPFSREVLLQARAWWPISTHRRYNLCFVLFILVFLTYICLQVHCLTRFCRSLGFSNKLYEGSWSLTHNLVCRGVFFVLLFYFISISFFLHNHQEPYPSIL